MRVALKKSLSASLLFCVITGCVSEDRTPRLGQSLPYAMDQIEPAFDQRLKSMFPVGSDENALRAELTKEGFQIKTLGGDSAENPLRYRGEFDLPGLVCRKDWVVLWDADAGKIRSIHGRFYSACL